MKRSKLKAPIPFLTKLFISLFFVLVGYTVIAQTIFIPRAVSKQYNQNLQSDFKQLRAKFYAVSQSTQLGIYNDPYSNVKSGRQDLLATQKLIAETEQSLSNYEQRASLLPSSPFAPYTESYKKSQIVRVKAKDIFLQSREVLNGYKDLTAYLLQINTARTVLQNNTADINSLADLNQLAGQGDIIAQRADQLGGTISTMKQLRAPTEFRDYQAELIASLQQSQAGLIQLAQGLNANSDTQIDAGANALGQAISDYESKGSALFITASENSSVLKEASMLADKIVSLQPFLHQ